LFPFRQSDAPSMLKARSNNIARSSQAAHSPTTRNKI
jgi:hypothetical protein